MYPSLPLPLSLLLALHAVLAPAAAAPAPPPQGRELRFLDPPPAGPLLHSDNRLVIGATSLDDGWVSLTQCHRNLDAVPDAEVVYRYKAMRGLRVAAARNIEKAWVDGASVQMKNVGHDASLCVELEARILYAQGDGRYVLVNGPFHRRFLDGYFPMHVTLTVHYPPGLLSYTGSRPPAQPGFEVCTQPGQVRMDARFSGMLTIETRFRSVQAR